MILATDEKSVQGFIEFELIKLAERINVSGNLTDSQVEFIASQLMGLYPNETIADFKICFEKGASGAYGKIFKLDGVEIGNWMKSYLDEKYTVMETELMKEKDNMYQAVSQNKDYLQIWKEAIEKTDKEGGVKTQSQNLSRLSYLKGLTDKEIKEEGQVEPKKELHPRAGIDVWAEYANRIVEGRKRHFKTLYPNATDEDVEIYLNSFNDML